MTITPHAMDADSGAGPDAHIGCRIALSTVTYRPVQRFVFCCMAVAVNQVGDEVRVLQEQRYITARTEDLAVLTLRFVLVKAYPTINENAWDIHALLFPSEMRAYV